MADQFVGRLIGFRGEDEYFPQTEVLVEVTEVEAEKVEIAFNVPNTKQRLYLQVSLADLIRHAMKGGQHGD